MIHLSKIKSALGLDITAAALLALTGCVVPPSPGPGPEGHGGHHHHHHMHGPEDGRGPERGPM